MENWSSSEKRFKKVFEQGVPGDFLEIWLDVEAGVNYLFRKNGNSGGLTPLINPDGSPVFNGEYQID